MTKVEIVSFVKSVRQTHDVKILPLNMLPKRQVKILC